MARTYKRSAGLLLFPSPVDASKNSVKIPAIVGTMFLEKFGLTLAVLSLCGLGHAETDISSDTYFYGESPAVYPSRMSPSFSPSIRSVYAVTERLIA